MRETRILVAIRYPLEAESVKTLQRAIELADEQDPAELSILHINALHRKEDVTKQALIHAVEEELGPLENATYNVINAFLIEEAILQEAIQQEAAYVVIGADTRGRWRQILTHRLNIDVDIESFLEHHLNAQLVVV